MSQLHDWLLQIKEKFPIRPKIQVQHSLVRQQSLSLSELRFRVRGYHKKASEFFGTFYSQALKGNSALEKACLMGIVGLGYFQYWNHCHCFNSTYWKRDVAILFERTGRQTPQINTKSTISRKNLKCSPGCTISYRVSGESDEGYAFNTARFTIWRWIIHTMFSILGSLFTILPNGPTVSVSSSWELSSKGCCLQP